MSKLFTTTWDQFKSASDGVLFRDQLIGFICTRLTTLNPSRKRLREFLTFLLKAFSRGEWILVRWKIQSSHYTITLRAGNYSDYAVFAEFVMGGYRLPEIQSRRPNCIIDGGANIGLFALRAHASFPEADITCYEIDPDNLKMLAKNLRGNGVSARISEKAMWSESGHLYYHPGSSYGGFVSRNRSDYPIDCELPVVPAGSWLKLDIEGAEYEVLPAIIARGSRPLVISMEIHDFANRGRALLDLLSANGYSWPERLKDSESCVTINAVLNEELR